MTFLTKYSLAENNFKVIVIFFMNEQKAQLLAADVESGSYYTSAARNWYSELFHTPIAQRSYYIFVILLSLINMYFAFDLVHRGIPD